MLSSKYGFVKLLVYAVVFCTIVSGSGLNVIFEWKELDFLYPNYGARHEAINRTFIPNNNVPVGLEVWKNKLFITVPRWKTGVPASLAYVDLKENVNINKSPLLKPYPNWEAHNLTLDISPRFGQDENVRIVSPFRIKADVCDRLWVMDTGKADILDSQEQIGSNQLLVFDLNTDHLLFRYEIPSSFTKHESFFANIAVDVKKSDCQGAFAYLADLGTNSMVVFSWRTKKAWKVSHKYFSNDPKAVNYEVAGISFQWPDGLFGLALSAEDEKTGFRTLYFHPFSSFSEFSVSTEILQKESMWEDPESNKNANEFKFLGSRGNSTQSCASYLDEKTGVLFYTQVTRNSVGCWNTKHKEYSPKTQGQVAVNDVTMVFPNDIKVDEKRNLWVLTDRMPAFIYRSLNYSDYNFRILSAPVDSAISDTVCASLDGSNTANIPLPLTSISILILSNLISKFVI